MTPLSGSRTLADGLTLEILQDTHTIELRAASWIAGTLIRVASSQSRCVLAISGGRSPWPMFGRLAEDPAVPWDRVHIMQVDERVAPEGHPDRNWTEAARTFGPVVPASNLHPMPVEARDLEAACDRYARLLEKLTAGHGLCIAHLGLGTDGHTASLFPTDSILEVRNRAVAITGNEHGGRRRMSLTFPALANAHRLLWQVQGASKAEMLARLLAGDERIPAGRVRRDTALVIADVAASSSED